MDKRAFDYYIAIIEHHEKNKFCGLVGIYSEYLGDFYEITGNSQLAEEWRIKAIMNYAKDKLYRDAHRIAVKLGNDDIAFVYAKLAGIKDQENKSQKRNHAFRKWLDFLKNK